MTLRIASSYFNPNNNFQINWDTDKDLVRILVLGESTTEAWWDGTKDLAWPGRLQSLLNERFPKKYKVYNMGLSATTSLMILNNLDDYLAEFQPHHVISMIGINDEWLLRDTHLRYNESISYRIRYYIKRLRVVKLFKDIRLRVQALFVKYNGYILDDKLLNIIIKSDKKQLKSLYNEVSDINQLKSIFMTLTSVTEQPRYNSISKENYNSLREVSIDLGNKLLSKNVSDSYLYTTMIRYSHETFQMELCNFLFEKSISEDIKITDADVAMGMRCHVKFHKKSVLPIVLEKFNTIYTNGHYFDNYIYHYRLINNKVTAFGAKHFAIQYANFPVSTLRYVFSKEYTETQKTVIDQIQSSTSTSKYTIDPRFKNIVILDNSDFSSKYANKYTYDQLFSDHIFGGTGHFTEEGHKLFGHEVFLQLKDTLR